MGVSLTAPQRQALVQVLVEYLPTLRVLYGSVLIGVRKSAFVEQLATFLPKSKGRATAGLQSLTDEAIAGFFLDRIQSLIQPPLNLTDEAVPLTDFLVSSDMTSVANALIDQFTSLPWKYLLLCQTPLSAVGAASAKQNRDLGDGYSLRAFSAEEARSLPLHDGHVFESPFSSLVSEVDIPRKLLLLQES